MSRDIFVQDIPNDVRAVEDIPDDWMPAPLPCSAEQVRATVLAVAPDADFSDPTWGRIVRPGIDIEVNLGDSDVLDSFAFHVRADDSAAAEALVADVLLRLGLRAFDPEGSDSGIFSPST
jgi:hypothetical protein